MQTKNFSDAQVLITGGLGFIGSNLVRRCLDMGMKVTVYDNLEPNSGGNLFNVESVRADFELVIGDIANYEDVVRVVMNKDLIINCAASTSHPYSMRDPWVNLEVNSRGAINILEAVKSVSQDVKIVHLGTTTQMGPLQYRPADENHPEFPTDVYSANKMVAEKYMLLYAKAYGLNTVAIRLPNVFGPRAAIRSSEFTFNNYFIGLAIQKQPITLYRPGTQLRNVLYVDDAVEAIVLAAQRDTSRGEVFLATSDHHVTVKEVAETTSEVFGTTVQMIDWPRDRSSIEIGDAVFTNTKIKKALGWKPIVGLEAGLQLALDYFKDKIDRYLT